MGILVSGLAPGERGTKLNFTYFMLTLCLQGYAHIFTLIEKPAFTNFSKIQWFYYMLGILAH